MASTSCLTIQPRRWIASRCGKRGYVTVPGAAIVNGECHPAIKVR